MGSGGKRQRQLCTIRLVLGWGRRNCKGPPSQMEEACVGNVNCCRLPYKDSDVAAVVRYGQGLSPRLGGGTGGHKPRTCSGREWK